MSVGCRKVRLPEKIKKQFIGWTILRENLSKVGFTIDQIERTCMAIVDSCEEKRWAAKRIKTDNCCTLKDILHVKDKLKDFIVSTKDKNKGQLFVECPAKYYDRLCQNTNDKGVFEEVALRSEASKILKNQWEMRGLNKYGGWKKGGLPYMYVLPKQKDPINKTRLIASYFNHPLRFLYKKVGAILQWGMKELKNMNQFTLLSQSDLRDKVKKSGKWLQGTFGADTKVLCIQTDIKQMFTYLDTDHIRGAIEWFLDKLLKAEKRRERNRSVFLLNKNDKKDVKLSTGINEPLNSILQKLNSVKLIQQFLLVHQSQ